MPIDRSRYSSDWPQISLMVRGAAGWCCVRCHRPCRSPGESWEDFGGRAIALGWGLELHKPRRFVLTTAHLDQNPRNDDWANLAALCVRCHLAHDRPHLLHNRRRKRERLGQLNLVEPPALITEPAGLGRSPLQLQPPLLG
jgi:hypothetical protein